MAKAAFSGTWWQADDRIGINQVTLSDSSWLLIVGILRTQ
jgi:hypothetical protein